MVNLIPDDFKDCQFGHRHSLIQSGANLTHAKPFLVFEDLTWPSSPTLVTHLRTSAVAWPKPTSVVDWEKVRAASGVAPCDTQTLSKTDHQAMHQLCANVVFRYIVGAGGDIPDRNFVYSAPLHQVVSVDEENIGNQFNLGSCLKKTRCELIKNHIKTYWQDVFQPKFKAWHLAFTNYINSSKSSHSPLQTTLQDFPHSSLLYSDIRGFIEEKIGCLADFDALMAVFVPKAATIKKRKVSAPFQTSADDMKDEDDSNDPAPPPKRAKLVQQALLPPAAPVAPPVLLGYITAPDMPAPPIGKAVCGGMKGKTASGTDYDVVKSDFQKAIRRGHIEQALKAFFELYNMPRIFPETTSAKGKRTNICNRALICALEDIGPADLPLVLAVCGLYNHEQDHAKKKTPGVSILMASQWAKVVTLMAKARKSRIPSHLYHAYGCPDNTPLLASESLSSGSPITANPITTTVLIDEMEKGNVAVWRTAFDAFQTYTKMIKKDRITPKKAMVEQDLSADKISINKVWEALSKVLRPRVYDSLYSVFGTITEKRPAYQLALTLALHRPSDCASVHWRFKSFETHNIVVDSMEIDSDLSEPVIETYEEWAKQVDDLFARIQDAHCDRGLTPTPCLEDLLTGNYIYEPQEIAFDKHTATGRKNSADRDKFVSEGAWVDNKHPAWNNAPLERIYKNSKFC